MGPHVYAARYRHRVSARLHPRHARRTVYNAGPATPPLPYVSDPAEYMAYHFADSRSNAFGIFRGNAIIVGKPDPYDRLHHGDADPDADGATDSGDQDSGEDTRGERDGDSEGDATSLWFGHWSSWGDFERRLCMAHGDTAAPAQSYTPATVLDPDTGDYVPDSVEDIKDDPRWDDDYAQWVQARHDNIAAYLADRVLGNDVEGD